MADDATDSAFGLVMFLLFLGLIAYAVGSTGTT
jgi:cbb3-type cytochrome oxidase subunit 3